MTDKRTEERIKRHEPHGWREIHWVPFFAPLGGAQARLMKCRCGWMGWIIGESVPADRV